MKRTALAISLCLCLLLSGCSSAESTFKGTFFAMDTVMTVEIRGEGGEEVFESVQEEIYRLEKLLDTDALNISEPLDDEIVRLTKRSLDISKLTDGAFDITVEPYVRAWGFSDKSYRVPEDSELALISAAVGYEKAKLDGNTLILPEGGSITFGAVAKGYAADRVYALLTENNITSAVISLGGNVILKGDNNGKPWMVGIESPKGNGEAVATLHIEDCFAVTSGDYHRRFTQGDKTYHHIIDPSTGYPAATDLSSVTVICRSGAEADALSTALFVMGSEKAVDFWRRSQYDFEFVLITKSGEMTVSSSLAQRITDVAEEYTLTVVKK